jgi:hypothetical protein
VLAFKRPSYSQPVIIHNNIKNNAEIVKLMLFKCFRNYSQWTTYIVSMLH